MSSIMTSICRQEYIFLTIEPDIVYIILIKHQFGEPLGRIIKIHTCTNNITLKKSPD